VKRRKARPNRTGEPKARPSARDQQESAFAGILGDLVDRVPGARAAALVDRDGETVDYSGQGDPYETRVAAAHLRIVLDEARAQPFLVASRSFVVRASRASFFVHALPEGYALIVRLARGAGFRGLQRAVPACARLLASEAGWGRMASEWHPVDVLLDERSAPRALRVAARRGAPPAPEDPELEVPLEVLGRFRAALPEHAKAWRVRIDSGAEFTLVRESGGFWYIDEPLLP
jgi:hypothetical protein